MADRNARAVFEAWIDVLNRRDWDALDDVIHGNYVEEYPQMGERIRGLSNLRRILENYPGGLDTGSVDGQSLRVMADEERWVMTPTFTVLRLVTSSDVTTSTLLANYPDGSRWYVVGFWEIKDGRLWRGTTYFAPQLEAPEWRAAYVERM